MNFKTFFKESKHNYFFKGIKEAVVENFRKNLQPGDRLSVDAGMARRPRYVKEKNLYNCRFINWDSLRGGVWPNDKPIAIVEVLEDILDEDYKGLYYVRFKKGSRASYNWIYLYPPKEDTFNKTLSKDTKEQFGNELAEF